MRRITSSLGICLVTCGLAGACAPFRDDGTSSSYLIISTLEGASGARPDAAGFAQHVSSDVSTNGRVVEDVGRVVFGLALKDPGTAALPTQPSPANVITIERYRVRYLRSDGRQVPGVDVPYAFDGGLTVAVGPEGAAATFVLVRPQAKLEPPLASLKNQGGSIVLSTIAEITFHGRDQSGRVVTVVGLISVNFADWADDEKIEDQEE